MKNRDGYYVGAVGGNALHDLRIKPARYLKCVMTPG